MSKVNCVLFAIVIAALTLMPWAQAGAIEPWCDSPDVYPVGDYPIAVTIADVDDDGDSDMAVANVYDDNVSIFLNDGQGNFIESNQYAVGDGPVDICFEDLDSDQDLDILVANTYSCNLIIRYNSGDGTFVDPVIYPLGNYPRAMCVADVNNDTYSDVVVANFVSDNVSILLNQGDGTMGSARYYPVGDAPDCVIAEDWDSDGDIDLATSNEGTNNVTIMLNNGDGISYGMVSVPAGTGPHGMCIIDINNDHFFDIFVSNFKSDDITVLLNDGQANFTPALSYSVGDEPVDIIAADIDGDSYLDLVVANRTADNVEVLFNDGSGGFLQPVAQPVGDAPRDLGAADFDNDGDIDVAVVNRDSDNMTILENCSIGFGAVSGKITAFCGEMPQQQLAVTVDVYSSEGDLVFSTISDPDGSFYIDDIPSGQIYTIGVIPPIGYTAESEEYPISIQNNEIIWVDFILTCDAVVAEPRSPGFWKHQVGVALGGQGHAHISGETLCCYLDIIAQHFNSNSINQVIVYNPPISGLCSDKLLEARELLNLKGRTDMIAKARKQLLTVLMNVASARLSLMSVITEDGATLSQAITFCDQLIDEPGGDHQLAKDICEMLNQNHMIGAGVIPLETANIAYKRSTFSEEDIFIQNYPNPFNPVTTFSFCLPSDVPVNLAVHNLLGRKVTTLVNEILPAGTHEIRWNGVSSAGHPTASGVYFARFKAGDYTITRRIVIVK